MSGLNLSFSDLSADGSTETIKAPVDGKYAVYVSGTFGGGTANIDVSRDAILFISAGSVTIDSRTIVDLLAGESIKVTLTGATAPVLSSGII